MGVLWALEDDVGEMSEEGVEAGLHAPDHLYFPGQLISEELLNRFVVGDWIFLEQICVSGEDDSESIVRNLGSHF